MAKFISAVLACKLHRQENKQINMSLLKTGMDIIESTHRIMVIMLLIGLVQKKTCTQAQRSNQGRSTTLKGQLLLEKGACWRKSTVYMLPQTLEDDKYTI